jgi:hypothetical protein
MKKLVFLGLIAAGGCAKTSSADLLTHGMSADIEAKATGDGTTNVSATLYVGDPSSLNFVELQGDDELLASFDGGTEEPMDRFELGNIVSYGSTFQGDNGGTSFTVDFSRTVDAGAPDSTGTLPDPFAIDPTGTANSRAATLTLTWSPVSTDLMRWDASGPCIDPTGESIPADGGMLAIDAGTLVKSAAQGTPDSCTISISITREHLGSLDPGYGHGGQVSGQQVRTVMFTSTP